MESKNAEFVKSLRSTADFFEAHPELDAPVSKLDFTYYGSVNGKSVDSVEGLAEFTRIVGGRIDKTADDNYFRLAADREGFKLNVVAYRDNVCERVQVGTKIEPGHVLPAQAETYVAAREVPIYEYRCPSILSASREEAETAAEAAGTAAETAETAETAEANVEATVPSDPVVAEEAEVANSAEASAESLKAVDQVVDGVAASE